MSALTKSSSSPTSGALTPVFGGACRPVPTEPGRPRAAARRSTERILVCVTNPVPTRFTDDELALIDQLVAEGIGDSRSAVIRRGVLHLADSVRRARGCAAMVASYREHPQTPDDDELAMASAIVLTEAEPW